jgi:glucose/arabinose dehydrogenase
VTVVRVISSPIPRLADAFTRRVLLLSLLPLFLLTSACTTGPTYYPSSTRTPIDRRLVECPENFQLQEVMTGLTSPTAICFDDAGNMFVAEGGLDGRDPRIFYIRKSDDARVDIYPVGTRIPIPLVSSVGYHIYGPIGGMAAYHGKLFVSHRDYNDMGAITAFDYNGNHQTIIANLPAQGDFGVTDVAIPTSSPDPRLYFGVGAATNSGVVGLDNWEAGWARDHPQACDIPYVPLFLLGFRFDVPNPQASLFSPGTLVTVPFQPLGISDIEQVPAADFPLQKPTGAVMSVALDGGDERVEAHGLRDPVGLSLDDYGNIYVTNRGMELRGTRPIDNDPDALYRWTFPGTWFGFPDYSSTFDPIYLPKYQPPPWMVLPTGYPDVRFVVDHETSKLQPPPAQDLLSQFPWQSGVSKMAWIPESGPFHIPRYEGQLLVALWGDSAPFSTSGRPIPNPLPGYRVVLVDPNQHGKVSDFVFNTQAGPASKVPGSTSHALERPIDVKFSPDGNLYILDFGQADFKHSQLTTPNATGKIYELIPTPTQQ